MFGISQVATPGPANMALLATGAAFGFRSVIPFVLGVVLGKQIIIWPSGFGIALLLDEIPVLFDFLKALATIYILWLAYRLSKLTLQRGSKTLAPPTFFHGLILHPLNPKAWAMVITSFASFTEPGSSSFTTTLTISLFFLFCQSSLHPLWCWGGERLAQIVAGKRFERYLMLLLASLTVLSLIFIY